MKFLKLLLIAFVTVSVLFACKKKDSVPAPPVAGFWKGGYSGAMPYAMLFRNNGTVRVYTNNNADTAAADKAEGTYTVSGTTINTTYTFLSGGIVKVSTTATANTAFNTMTGTWGEGTATSGGGTITLTKQ